MRGRENWTLAQRGRRTSAYATRDLTQGSIPRNLWFLGWPQIISGAVNAIDTLADLFWAGFLGSRAVATVGVAQTWIQLFNTGRMGLDTSARAMVSRAVGSGNLAQASDIARQSVIFNVGLSLVVMVIGIGLSDFLLKVLGVSDALVEEGSTYQRLRFAGSFFFGLNMISGSLLQAGGDTLTPMKAQLVTRASHLILSPVLTFGWGGLPAFGVSGAAIANGISQGIGSAMNFWALYTGTSRIQLSMNNLKVELPLMWRQVQIGGPASVTAAERAIAQVVLVGLAAPFGTAGLAVFSITQRIQMFGGFGAQGLAQASGVIVGQSLGAQQPKRAKETVWWALGYNFAIQGLVCALIFAFPEAVILVFSRDPEVMEIAGTWLRIEVLGYMLFSLANVLVLSFNTAGDTTIPMLAALGGIWGVQQPVAILLTGAAGRWLPPNLAALVPISWNLGILGIAWANVAAAIARFIFLFLYFMWGPWWKKNVLQFSQAPVEIVPEPAVVPPPVGLP
ncbi:MAG: MATE family efflux transporter [Chloroflexi bacterium]|nr:MATE family efflux transporter [Chloroflexota bacterium]